MGLVCKDGREQLELQEAYEQCTCKVGVKGGWWGTLSSHLLVVYPVSRPALPWLC